MAARTLLPLALLLLVGLAACGGEEDGEGAAADAHPIVGHWEPVAPVLPDGSVPPGFIHLGNEGVVEQFDGRSAYHGRWEVEGDSLVLSQIEGMPPAPPMTWRLEGSELVLTMTTAQGERPMRLRRGAGPRGDVAAGFDRLAGRFEQALQARIGALAEERAKQRGQGETVVVGGEVERTVREVTADLEIPWSLAVAGGEPRTGAFVFAFVWHDGGWKLVHARLRDDALPDMKPPDLVQVRRDGTPQVNDDSPFAGAVWQAWIDVIKD